MSKNQIRDVLARQVWDSRGRPTIEVEITLRYGATGRAIAPAGASTGSGEVLDLRDGGSRFGGFGVSRAIASVNGEIRTALKGKRVDDQAGIDQILTELDGTGTFARLGGNATVATSMAVLQAAAAAEQLPLWQYIGIFQGNSHADVLPLPEIQIFGGGVHAGRRVDVQDFMITAIGASSFAEALEWTADVYRAAGKLMADSGRLLGVADEGGFWPAFDSNEEALETLTRAIEASGHRPGHDLAISLDIAASDFGSAGTYTLARDKRQYDSDQLSGMLIDWIERFPIVSIEDPLGEDDADAMERFTWAASKRAQIVGDDYLVTNAARIDQAARRGACNAVLIKPNQAGTISATRAAFDAAEKAGFGSIISARSGESEDTTIVHLGVGWGIRQLKVGSFSRSERMAKWNEGLRIADAISRSSGGTLPVDGNLPPASAFPWNDLTRQPGHLPASD